MLPQDHLDYLHSQKKEATPREAKYLFDNLITLLTGGRSNKMSPVVKLLFQKKPKRILDVGCGYGALAIFFALHGIEVLGIDLNSEEMESAENLAGKLGLGNVSFKQMDACDISVGGFDAAYSTDFYEHLPYESQLVHLQSVFTALNDDGMYIIRAPHLWNMRQQRTGHIGLPTFKTLAEKAHLAKFVPSFCIAHSTYSVPFAYQIYLENLLQKLHLQDETLYQTIKRLGMANILACLRKN